MAVAQLTKKHPTFRGTRKFSATFTRALPYVALQNVLHFHVRSCQLSRPASKWEDKPLVICPAVHNCLFVLLAIKHLSAGRPHHVRNLSTRLKTNRVYVLVQATRSHTHSPYWNPHSSHVHSLQHSIISVLICSRYPDENINNTNQKFKFSTYTAIVQTS
jgi:hypothetical protein